ncbi:hypothetical protein V6N13_105732 [Hibiscus sabdariffa]|uniref:RNase H type-1 domain-containing protein n=1 Tax=Hibiscus sabdariffa TaxID=183260 RepID=A0ABR2EYL2_9ROSI
MTTHTFLIGRELVTASRPHKFHHVCRTGNKVADKLARSVSTAALEVHLLSTPPTELLPLLHGDNNY